MPPLLKVENLKIYFHVPRGYVRAVDEASLELNEGEIIGVAGESGSGKSTLALGIMRLIMPPGFIEGGNVYFEGNEILHLPEKVFNSEYRWKRIAMVFQGSMNGFTPVYRIRDQIKEVLEVHGYTGDPDQRVNELMKMVNLDPSIADRYPHELSGGQRQRVAIARALMLNPEYLVADEPVTMLDASLKGLIVDDLRKINAERGISILFITHELPIAKVISHRIAIMYLGKIVEIGPTKKVIENPLHPYTQALLQAYPRLDPSLRDKMIKVNVRELELVVPKSGCRFHPRCPFVMDRCRTEEPALKEVEPGHFVACYLY